MRVGGYSARERRSGRNIGNSLPCSPFCVPWVSPSHVTASALGVPKAVSLLIPWVSPNRVTASTMGVPMPCHS